jgi:hypothetical protein
MLGAVDTPALETARAVLDLDAQSIAGMTVLQMQLALLRITGVAHARLKRQVMRGRLKMVADVRRAAAEHTVASARDPRNAMHLVVRARAPASATPHHCGGGGGGGGGRGGGDAGADDDAAALLGRHARLARGQFRPARVVFRDRWLLDLVALGCTLVLHVGVPAAWLLLSSVQDPRAPCPFAEPVEPTTAGASACLCAADRVP